MSPSEFIADCRGQRAAEDLLATSREIVDDPTYHAAFIKTAADSIPIAQDWLDRCRQCEASVAAGGPPLC